MFSEPISTRDLKPSFSASRTNGSTKIENCTSPFESAASASAVAPTGTSVTSVLGSIPSRLSPSRMPISVVVPARPTPPILPLSCFMSVTLFCVTMCAGNVGTIEAIMTTSAPVKREFTRDHRLKRHRTGIDGNELGVDTLLFHQALVLNNPNRCVGSAAGPGDAQPLLRVRANDGRHRAKRQGESEDKNG